MKLLLLACVALCLMTCCHKVQSCPGFWTEHAGSCYRYFGLPQTFATAAGVCQMFTGCSVDVPAAGLGHIASINTRDENQFIFSMLAGQFGEIPPPPSWLGLSDRNPQGTFRWEDGTIPSPDTFSAWGPNSPRQNHNSNCAIFAELILPRWIDILCEEELPYICEVPAKLLDGCPRSARPRAVPAPLTSPNKPVLLRYSSKANANPL